MTDGKKRVIAYVYIGQGSFLHDVPARDLTADEARDAGKLYKDAGGEEYLVVCGLYEPANPKGKKE